MAEQDGRSGLSREQRPTRWLRTFRSLHNYNFRLFWFGQLISLVGTWVQSVAQAWLVLEMTHSPIALGTVTALQFLPVLLLTLFAGVLVDRLPKGRMLLVTQSIAMVQAVVLAVLVSTGAVHLWHIYVLATVLGLVNAFDNPTRQAFMFEMVGREDVVNAVALNSTLFNGARIIGPALGGLIIAKVGIAVCFYFNALSYVAVLAGLLMIRENMLFSSPRRATGAMLRQLAEGLTYAARTPGVMLIVILMSTIGTFGYNFTVVLPLLARNALGVGADGFGALSSAMGLGSLMASLAMASFLGASRRVLIAGAAAFSLFEGGLALSGSYHVSLGLMVAIGVAGLLFTATANALLQLSVPDVLRGRVLSLYTLLFLGTTPIGGMVTGALADRFGIQVTIGIEAAISALGLIAGLVYVLAQQKRAATRSSYRLTDDLSDSNK